MASSFCNEMPFYSCNDYQLRNEFLSFRDRFFEMCESNNFSEQMQNVMNTVNNENFSFRYYNEHSIQSSIQIHKTKALRVYHMNVRSIQLHKVEVAYYLDTIKTQFQIILLSETGRANISTIEAYFPEYKFFIDQPSSSKGGAGILIRKDCFSEVNIIDDFQIKLNCECSQCKVESKFLKLKNESFEILVGAIYRHPNGNIAHFNDSWQSTFKNVKDNEICIVGGDMNFDLLKMECDQTTNNLENCDGSEFVSCHSRPN